MDEHAIVIEGNINDRLPSLRYLIEKLAVLTKAEAEQAASIDLSQVHYLGPDGVTMIVGSILEARSRRVSVNVVGPSQPPALQAFLEFSGFNHEIYQTKPADAQDSRNVTVGLRRFIESRHDDVEPIVKLIRKFQPVSDDLRRSLEIALNECVQNVEDHSLSPIGGLGCARFMTASNEVRVALIDWGQGILGTLGRHYPDIVDDQDALFRVLHGGYSAKSRRNNLGRGLDNLRSVVAEFMGGNLYVVSGAGAAEVRGRAPTRTYPLSVPFRGTAVCFTLPVVRQSSPETSVE